MSLFSDWKDAIREASYDDSPFTAHGWMDFFATRDFLIVLLIAFFIGFIITDSIAYQKEQERIANCNHINFVMETADLDEKNKELTIQCERCKGYITYKPEITIDTRDADCTQYGYYREWWTFSAVPSMNRLIDITFPQLPHEMGKITVEGYPATCTEPGVADKGHCANCYNVFGGEAIVPLGHDYQPQGYVAPTCISTGLSGIDVCTVCGDDRGKTSVLPMIDHTCIAVSRDATYNVSGYTGTACSYCSFPISMDEVREAPLVYDYFDFLPTDDGAGLIVTGVKRSEASMVIPDHVDGVPVLYLADGLFENNTALSSITLSKNLLEISAHAFSGCTALKSITLPDSASHIGARAFANCSNLLFVDMGDGIVSAEQNAFENCTRILSFKFSPDYDLENYGLSFADKIPVLYAPKEIWYYSYYHREWVNLSPKHIYFYGSTAEPTHIYEEDGYYFYNDGKHKVLLYCEESCVKDGILCIPEGTNVIGASLLYRVRNVEGIVMGRSVYCIQDQRWVKDEWQYSGSSSMPNYLYIYYRGNEIEADFIDLGELDSVGGTNYSFYDVFCYGAEFRGWILDENGKPVITDKYY